MKNKPRLLLVGDFVKHTGFARVNEAIAKQLCDRWDIAVLGVNYKGDHCEQQQQYRLYPAWLGGDDHGVGRLADVVRVEQPDACLFVCDPWIGAAYAHELATLDAAPHSLLYTPVDATGLRRVDVQPLNGFDQVVAYTAFGARELRSSGYAGPLAVIPHGIDLGLFQPLDQAHARAQVGLPIDWFCVLILDQNNPRKRLDIAFDAFARFAADKPDRVKLVYHGPLGGKGRWDIRGMVRDLGLENRIIYPHPQGLPLPDDQLSVLYSMCDVKLSTTSGEGWGLTTMEAMACGLPNIAPDFAALGEWAADAVELIPAETPLRHVEINTVGRSPTAESAVDGLAHLYRNAAHRARLTRAGLSLVAQPQYRWPHIADLFDALLRGALTRTPGALTRTPVALNTRPNTIDDWVVEQVIAKDEYGLGSLAPDDLVIDVGAHIGAFSRLAYDRGSRHIEAYEADADNAEMARSNLSYLGIAVTRAAVWRSDVRYPCVLSFTGHDGRNTGAGNVVFGDGLQIEVWATALDDIIGDSQVAVLKIDAESAEWPILLTSKKLDQVMAIVGEYHEIGGAHDHNHIPLILADMGYERLTIDVLSSFLSAQGFNVSYLPYVLSSTGTPSNMGSFRAVRRSRKLTPVVPLEQQAVTV